MHSQGPAFEGGFVSEPFENVNIYSLMCHLLGIKPTPNNGSLQAVETQTRLYGVDS